MRKGVKTGENPVGPQFRNTLCNTKIKLKSTSFLHICNIYLYACIFVAVTYFSIFFGAIITNFNFLAFNFTVFNGIIFDKCCTMCYFDI